MKCGKSEARLGQIPKPSPVFSPPRAVLATKFAHVFQSQMWLLAAAPGTWLGTAATAASRCTTVVCGSKYGTKEYWDGMYRGEGEAARDGLPSDRFSWYCSWQELRPFWEELAPPSVAAPRVLVPGVGVDGAIAELFDAGWRGAVLVRVGVR